MPRKSHGSGSRRPVCVFCGLQGHTVEKCYKKHGYPPGYKPKTKQHVGSINQLEIAELSVPNQVACGSNQNSDVQTQSSPVFPFSQDQYHKLLALIQSPSPVNNATSTINALSLTSNFYIVPDMAAWNWRFICFHLSQQFWDRYHRGGIQEQSLFINALYQWISDHSFSDLEVLLSKL